MAAEEYVRQRQCCADGCDATNILALGYCPKHYYRFKKRGSTELPAPYSKLCEVSGCLGKATRKGLCNKHYGRLAYKGSTDDPIPKGRSVCTVDGCGRQVKGNGFCQLHLGRMKRHNNPHITRSEARRALSPMGECALCGKSIQKLHSSQRFCSQRCNRRYAAGQSHFSQCQVCGVDYVRTDGNLCCSEQCNLRKKRERHRLAKAQERQTEEGKRRHIDANRRYIRANKKKVNEYWRRRRRSDPEFRMACLMRSSLTKLLKRINQRKRRRTAGLLGYNAQELKAHIERQFLRGMNWTNYGKWHVDHIVPVAEHIRRGEKDPSVINALTNLRPLWANENIVKSDRVVTLL